jgi:hypothetical protein
MNVETETRDLMCRCNDCEWRADFPFPTSSDRQRPRDHARRHGHEVEVTERKVLVVQRRTRKARR